MPAHMLCEIPPPRKGVKHKGEAAPLGESLAPSGVPVHPKFPSLIRYVTA